MSEGENFYTILQAAELLGVPPKRIHELVDEGELEAHRDEESGHWLINTRAVHARLKAFSLDPRGSRVVATATVPDAPRENRFFDLLVLLIIGGITLLAAGYTLLPMLFGS
jgi:excisionase family DNA binding protein